MPAVQTVAGENAAVGSEEVDLLLWALTKGREWKIYFNVLAGRQNFAPGTRRRCHEPFWLFGGPGGGDDAAKRQSLSVSRFFRLTA